MGLETSYEEMRDPAATVEWAILPDFNHALISPAYISPKLESCCLVPASTTRFNIGLPDREFFALVIVVLIFQLIGPLDEGLVVYVSPERPHRGRWRPGGDRRALCAGSFAPVLSFLLQALKDMLSLDALIETLLFLQTNNACEANAVILAAELLMAASPEAMHSALKSSGSLPGLIHYSFCQV